MREFLFRGKQIDNGEWVYGYVVSYLDGELWIKNNIGYTPVVQETIGQYTEKYDVHRKKIFEGDIVKCNNYHGEVEGVVRYFGGCPYLDCTSGYSDEYLFNCEGIEVIGNIYDNKELIKEDTECL